MARIRAFRLRRIRYEAASNDRKSRLELHASVNRGVAPKLHREPNWECALIPEAIEPRRGDSRRLVCR